MLKSTQYRSGGRYTKGQYDPQSSAQGTVANAPLVDEAAAKESSTQAEENPTAGPTPAPKDNVTTKKENSLDNF